MEDEDDSTPPLPAVPRVYACPMSQQVEEDLVTLDAIRQSRDVPALRRWAHRVCGGLSMFGPSMLFYTCEELRAVLRESDAWVADIDAFIVSIRADLGELRSQQLAALQT